MVSRSKIITLKVRERGSFIYKEINEGEYSFDSEISKFGLRYPPIHMSEEKAMQPVLPIENKLMEIPD